MLIGRSACVGELRSRFSCVAMCKVRSSHPASSTVSCCKQVEEDRRPQVEAAIVRVLKARRLLDHNSIVAQVVPVPLALQLTQKL